MKKTQSKHKDRRHYINSLLDRVGWNSNGFYDQLRVTVENIVSVGKRELRERAETGLSKLKLQLNIPSRSEIARLQDRITKLEKKIKFEQHVAQ